MSWLERLSDEQRSKLREEKQPSWIPPMLATLTHDPFSNEAWIYERKLDGQRVLAFRDGSGVRLMSRNRKPNTQRYPEIADALAGGEPERFVADGEVVAFESGVSSFAKLQPRMQINDSAGARASGVRVFYYMFDVLYLDGFDLRAVPLRARKSVLRNAFTFEDPLRYTPHRNAAGEAFLREACRSGWEGLIAKNAAAVYQSNRSRDWLKFKCSNQQEFVVGGFTDPQGGRVGLGALLIGYYDGDELRYAGKVGTGFTHDVLRALRRRLASIERKTPPFSEDGIPKKDVHWVRPELVAEVAFTEWTADDRLRHPRFVGLRDDKSPRDVVKEEA